LNIELFDICKYQTRHSFFCYIRKISLFVRELKRNAFMIKLVIEKGTKKQNKQRKFHFFWHFLLKASAIASIKILQVICLEHFQWHKSYLHDNKLELILLQDHAGIDKKKTFSQSLACLLKTKKIIPTLEWFHIKVRQTTKQSSFFLLSNAPTKSKLFHKSWQWAEKKSLLQVLTLANY